MNTHKRKTALITGAQDGLGREFGKLYAGAGHDLVLVDRHRRRLEALAGAFRDIYGIDVRVIDIDLSAPGAGRRITAQLARWGLRIDVIITRSGYRLAGPLGPDDIPGAVHRVCEEYRLPRPRVDAVGVNHRFQYA